MKAKTLAVGIALLSLLTVAATAQAQAPALGKHTAAKQARAALGQESLGKPRHIACRSRSRQRAVCHARWSSGLRRYRATITVTRTGIPTSPIDTYRISAVSGGKYLDRRRERADGRIIVETRHAAIGQPLQLLGYDFDHSEVEITVEQPVDPFVSPNEFSTPQPGTRFVAFTATVRNLGTGRFATGLYGARLILSGDVTLDVSPAVGCDSDMDMAPGETRHACVAFEVPVGATIEQFEWSPGQETGVWIP